MRIFGGHDYYDCGLSLGIDPNITLTRYKDRRIFDRDLRTDFGVGNIRLNRAHLSPSGKWLTNDLLCHIQRVVFCDRVYTGVWVPSDGEPTAFWDRDKLVGYMQEGNFRLSLPWMRSRNRASLLDLMGTKPVSEELRGYMIANRLSILVRDETPEEEPGFYVNPPNLRSLQFAKVLDPYTAFSELSMWIGGVLGGVSPEVARITDDKVLIQNHGFDPKTSFRGPRL